MLRSVRLFFYFTIGRFGDDIRWEKLDEDVHISSFYDTTEPNPDNEVARIFSRFPQINVSEMAKYIYGIKKPSVERMQKIRQAFHMMGQELIAV